MGTKELQNGHGAQWKVEQAATSRARTHGDRCTLVGESELLRVMEAVTQAGGYFSVGQTSDGGSLVLRVLDGSDKLTTYVHSAQELREALIALKQRYNQTYPHETRIRD